MEHTRNLLTDNVASLQDIFCNAKKMYYLEEKVDELHCENTKLRNLIAKLRTDFETYGQDMVNDGRTEFGYEPEFCEFCLRVKSGHSMGDHRRDESESVTCSLFESLTENETTCDSRPQRICSSCLT